jgi:hypothetical protein
VQMCRPCMAPRAQAFRVGLGPFSGPGKKSAGMQPTLLVTTGRRHNVDGHLGRAGQILYRSKFNRPPSSSWLLRGGLAIPLPSRGKVVRTPHQVPVVKTCLLIPLWLMTGLLEISSLFLSRPPQALFASWAQPVFIMPLPIKRQRTWDGLEGQRARSTLNFTLVL